MAAIKKYNGSTWETTTARKYETATETIQSGDTIYADGTAATVSLKGNTTQSGTPTPSNPVEVNGVGERTENLFDYSDLEDGTLSNGVPVPYTGHKRTAHFIKVETSTTYTLSNLSSSERVSYYDSTKTYISNALIDNVFTTPNNCEYVKVSGAATGWTQTTMLTKGSTAPSVFIPFGYKIPISSGGVTTNIYLGSTQTVRQIYKLVFDGTENWSNQNVGQHGAVSIRKDEMPSVPNMPAGTLRIVSSHFKAISNSAQLNIGEMVAGGSYLNFDYDGTNNLTDFKAFLAAQYANGTPVTIWYVLATAETAAVNQPLMKIDTYADTLSNATIPTTDGANSITVDTTVQPSEFTATWTGWHDSLVKEKSENLFDGEWVQGSININGNLVSSSERIRAFQTVQPNTTYTFSSTKYVRLIYGYNGDEKVGVIYDVDANLSKSITFTTQSECNRIGIAIAASTTATGNITPSDISEVMLNTGSTALPYEPYWK